MFTVPGRNNPLAETLSALSEAAGPYLQQRKQGKSTQAIFEMLQNMPEDVSPLQFTRSMYSNPNIRPEDRAAAAKTFYDLQQAQAKQTAAERPGGSRGTGGDLGSLTAGQKQVYARYVKDARSHGEVPMPEDEYFNIRRRIVGEEPEEGSGQAQIGANESAGQQAPSMQQPAEQLLQPKAQAGIPPLSTQTGEPTPQKPMTYDELKARPKDEFLPPYKGEALAKHQKAWAKQNEEPFKDAIKKLHAAEQEADDIAQLKEINDRGNLPEGFDRMLIDPHTGDVYDTAKKLKNVHPDAQLYANVMAGRLRGLKGTFVGHATDLDLTSYMKQYPGLLNTQEGRNLIFDRLQMLNSINTMYDEALVQVYRKYGTDKISHVDADRLAQELIAPARAKARASILQLGREAANIPGQKFQEIPPAKDFPEGFVLKKGGKPVSVVKNGAWSDI